VSDVLNAHAESNSVSCRLKHQRTPTASIDRVASVDHPS
jgi:hypothetical protein